MRVQDPSSGAIVTGSYTSTAGYEIMGTGYGRCKAARNSNLKHHSTSCSVGDNIGFTNMRRNLPAGNLEYGSELGLALTFRVLCVLFASFGLQVVFGAILFLV